LEGDDFSRKALRVELKLENFERFETPAVVGTRPALS
jgi:hypothetical protein